MGRHVGDKDHEPSTTILFTNLPMEPRVSLITLGVADLERSLKFYRDGLGLPTTWTGEKGVVFAL